MMSVEVIALENREGSRSERFLKLYRVLEGMLDRRYSGRAQGSVVMEYLRDEDSEPFRHELDVCREIRNLLSHNADEQGEPLVEPSESVIRSLEEIVRHVSAPRFAAEAGTPKERIFYAQSNDIAIEVMHRMRKLGYSHVPVMEKGRIVGVFSSGSLFSYLEKNGLDALQPDARIGQLKDVLHPEQHDSEKYLFMPESATVLQVRAEFENRGTRNSRLSAVFITPTGVCEEPLLAMLTPWDVLGDNKYT